MKLGLRMKFNFALAGVLLAGMALAGWVVDRRLKANAREEVLREAGLMMEAAIAVRTYTVDQVRPFLAPQMEQRFLPQTVPAYAATETLAALGGTHPGYRYKEAVLNPTNPRDLANGWEVDLVERFRTSAKETEAVGQLDGSRPVLYIARPIRISNGACLQCHSTPAAAPPSMRRIYGDRGGFGWQHGETVGAQVVTVPMEVPLARAQQALQTFMVSLLGVFAALFVVLNLMLSWLIVAPVRRLSVAADRVSTGDFQLPELTARGHDEIATLANSFNRLRRSLEKAMQMLSKH